MTVIGLMLVEVLVLSTGYRCTRRRVSAAVHLPKSFIDSQEKTVEENTCQRRAKELERPAPKGNTKGWIHDRFEDTQSLQLISTRRSLFRPGLNNFRVGDDGRKRRKTGLIDWRIV